LTLAGQSWQGKGDRVEKKRQGLPDWRGGISAHNTFKGQLLPQTMHPAENDNGGQWHYEGSHSKKQRQNKLDTKK